MYHAFYLLIRAHHATMYSQCHTLQREWGADGSHLLLSVPLNLVSNILIIRVVALTDNLHYQVHASQTFGSSKKL